MLMVEATGIVACWKIERVLLSEAGGRYVKMFGRGSFPHTIRSLIYN